MKTLFAVDPGTEHSAYIIWSEVILAHGDVPNDELRRIIKSTPTPDLAAIEMVASYGMPVGKETFETVRWIGRFEECFQCPVRLVYRQDIKLNLCKSPRAKDSNVMQALKDKYGPVGNKKKPGPLYGISGHKWAALAVADYILSTQQQTT